MGGSGQNKQREEMKRQDKKNAVENMAKIDGIVRDKIETRKKQHTQNPCESSVISFMWYEANIYSNESRNMNFVELCSVGNAMRS